MKHCVPIIIMLLLAAPIAEAFAGSDVHSRHAGWCKKKKKKKKAQGEDETPKNEVESTQEGAESGEEDTSKVDEEQKRVEEAKKKIEAEGRKESQITPGTASRWSNRGAMTPIVAEVPITAPLPERAVPVVAGTVETPGQPLLGNEELLQARLYFFGYHLATSGQDTVYKDDPTQNPGATTLVPTTRSFDLFRGRASMNYERMAGSNFGTHLDLEYRTKASGNIPTDHRVNELYLSYGLTDFRRSGGPDFGVALGRVAIREAGYAQTDGIALRMRIGPDINFGAFGGVTGNPYGYNWLTKQNEEFSSGWLRGGAFIAYRTPRIFANVAGVATFANSPSPDEVAATGMQPKSGLDRLYLYGDASYLATESVNLFATGWIDFIGGLPIQNLHLVASYAPSEEVNLRLALGRFSTIVYDISTAYTYSVDRFSNTMGVGISPNTVILDENGTPIVPYNAALATAMYDSIEANAGYRFTREIEGYLNADVIIRDTSKTDEVNVMATGATLQFSSLRLVPSVGARYRNPLLFDASAQLAYIVDQVSLARA
jgi:hypothetical protein